MAVALAPEQWAVTDEVPPGTPSPYLLPPAPRRRHRSLRARRRLWARRVRALLIVAGLVLAVRAVPGGHGSAPLSAPEPVRARAASSAVVHIVQPGETLWSIARHLQPEGEVRPLVDRLAALRRGRPLRAGDRIDLTALAH